MGKHVFYLSATLLLAQFVSGCWTFGKTDYPQVSLTAAEGNAAKLALAVNGFESTVTDYEMVPGYSAVYFPGHYGRRHYHPGYVDIQPTYATIRQTRVTDIFLIRARESFEDAGFTLAQAPTVPDYSVEVHFGGPLTTGGDVAASVAWPLLTAFFCDYEGAEWTARMRIRDNRTGKVVFTHDYSQRYEAHAFGLIPLFSIASCDETTSDYAQSWCLAALTDRAVADASAFFASR